MTLFDVILLFLLAGFVILGIKAGFIQTFGSVLGAFGGAFIAGLSYEFLAKWLVIIWHNENLMKIFSFIFIFILVNRLIGFIFYVIDKAFRLFSVIPFLKTANKLLGGVMGFVEGLLVIGLSLYILSRFPISDWFTGVLQDSLFATWFVGASVLLQMVLPEMLRQLKSVI